MRTLFGHRALQRLLATGGADVLFESLLAMGQCNADAPAAQGSVTIEVIDDDACGVLIIDCHLRQGVPKGP